MGFWDFLKNINNADGIREAMCRSYDANYELAEREELGGDYGFTEPMEVTQAERDAADESVIEMIRFFALFRALEARFLVSGVPTEIAEKLVWAELLPFLYLDKATGRKALSEYVVYKEMPADANVSWLETVVQKGYKLAKSKEDRTAYDTWMPEAKANEAVWLFLLEGRGNEYFWG